jgi:hypothetical protein
MLAVAVLVAGALQLTSPASSVFAVDEIGGEDETCEFRITKSNDIPGADEVEEGDTFTWTLFIEWDSDCDDIDYDVDDNIPPGFDVLGVSETQDSGTFSCNNDDPVDCSGQTLANGGEAEVEIDVEVDGESCGEIDNDADVDPTEDAFNDNPVGDSDSDTVEVECPDATITIIKDTNPESSSPDFDFEIDQTSGGSFNQDFELEDDESIEFDVEAGTYVVSEDVPGDWDLVDIDCDGSATFSDEGEEDGDVRITIDSGETATCTFTNEPEDDDPPVVVLIPTPVVQRPPTTQAPPAPTARPVTAVAPALPRAGQGASGGGDSDMLLIGSGMMAVAGVGLAAWRLRRSE